MKNLLVQKYGGSSLETTKRVRAVAQHICDCLVSQQKLVVVVSAMGKKTDELLTLASSLHLKPPKRELDMLVTTGERISMSLLSIALDGLGIKAISLTGSQSGILTDEVHGNARIAKIKPQRILDGLKNYQVVIVAGYQGVCPKSKEITSLGRGGSDLTAVALAIELNARNCEIYTDVEGVFSCDPQKVVAAKKLSSLSWRVMRELSWAGAGVLHSRAAFLASKFNLNVTIKSSFSLDKEGTVISSEGLSPISQSSIDGDVMESALVEAISYKDDRILVDYLISGSPDLVAALATLGQYLWSYEESPQFFRQHFYEEGEVSLSLVLASNVVDKLDERVMHFVREHNSKVLKSRRLERMASISLIGQGFLHSPEIFVEATKALGSKPFFCDQGDSQITVLVDQNSLYAELAAWHSRFITA